MKEKYVKNISDNSTFSKNGFSVFLPKIDNDEISICFVDVEKERDNYCLLDNSTLFYYIINGNGEFEINDYIIPVTTNDLIEIPPKNKFSYKGTLKMLEIQSNSFNEKEVHEFPK